MGRVPHPQHEKVSARISVALKERLGALGAFYEVSESEIVRRCLERSIPVLEEEQRRGAGRAPQ